MTGTPLETLPRRTAFARSYGTRSTLLPTIRAHGPDMEAVPDGTFSRDFPSPWCTCCAGTKSKSSPWLTVGDGRATGGRDSDPPSNFRMQRPALRVAADPARSPDLELASRDGVE
jgi:hypothetical protein